MHPSLIDLQGKDGAANICFMPNKGNKMFQGKAKRGQSMG